VNAFTKSPEGNRIIITYELLFLMVAIKIIMFRTTYSHELILNGVIGFLLEVNLKKRDHKNRNFKLIFVVFTRVSELVL